MSNSSSVKIYHGIIAASSVAFLLAGYIYWQSSNSFDVTRDIKKATILAGKNWAYTQKLQPPIQIKITKDANIVITADENFNLVAKVSVDHPVERLELKWLLPEGVTAESGSLSQVLMNLKAGEEHFVEINLSQNSADNKQIHFSAKADSFAKSVQFNTMDQEAILASTKSLKERAEKDLNQRFKRKLPVSK